MGPPVRGVSRLNRPTVRALLTSAAIAAALALAGCNPDNIPTGRSQAPLSERTLADIEAKQMDKDSPILARIFKEEAEMEVWKKNRDGQYALLKTYPICRWSGDLGPKKKEGDRQAPEGAASILWRDTAKAQEAATNMKITAQDMVRFGVIDKVIVEPTGGAHRDPPAAIAATGDAIANALAELRGLSAKAVRDQRREKFLAMGRNMGRLGA